MIAALLTAAVLAAAPAAPDEAAPALSLDDAVAAALSHRPSLAAARSQAAAARAQARAAFGALLPSLDATGSYGASRGRRWPDTSANPAVRTDLLQKDHAWSAGLSASQLLWDFGSTGGRAAAADAQAAAAAASARAAELDVAEEVRLAYFGLLQATALEQVARDTLGNQQRHLEQTQAMVEVGAKALIDLARLRTAVASAKASLIAAQNATRSARARLDTAMGLPGRPGYATVEPAVPPLQGEEAAASALLPEAERERQALAALRAQVEAQRQQLRATRGGLWPSLSLGGAVSRSDSGPKAFGDDTSHAWDASASLSLRWRLFDGLASQAAVDADRARLDAADAQLSSAAQALWEEIEDAVAGVASAREALPAAEEGLAAAKDLLGLAEAQYKEGVGDSLALADAELQLATAAGQRVQAVYGLASARARLLRALGRDAWR